MRFGVVANTKRPGARDALKRFSLWARDKGHQLMASSDLEELGDGSIQYTPRAELPGQADFLVSMGGDGTLLAAARLVGASEVPILGINLGSLGFLTQQASKDLLAALDAIVAGNYRIESRMILKTEVKAGTTLGEPFALNDVVLNNGPISRLIDIELRVNGESIVTYRADGLIIATPTGSTAYSMAAGGPIIQPGMQAIVATPISSFSLNSRPLVFSSDDRLELTTGPGSERPTLTLDGQVMVMLKPEDEVMISRAHFDLKLVVFPESSFYKVLRRKLHWGLGPLNEES